MALDISSMYLWTYILVGVAVLAILMFVIYRDKIYFKKTADDLAWAEAIKNGRDPYERSMNAAVICGVLIGFMAILFRHYFNDWQGIVGMAIVDLAVLLIIAYPARRPIMAVGILGLLIVPAGYIDYGPYAPLIVPQIEKVTGSGTLAAIPAMMGNSLHCVTILLTNPMAWQDECEMTKQKIADEQPPVATGIEIDECRTFPEKDIFAGDPLELYLSFTNKGSYTAKNLTVATNASTGAKIRVCDENIFKDVILGWVKNESEVKKDETFEYSLPGRVADPWTSKNCTYAENKMTVDAKIKTTISYDYATESSLTLKLARSLNDTTERSVDSAVETSSPMAIYMHTSAPMSWLDEAFRNRTIQLKVKNEYGEGYTIFRGKYGFKDVLKVKDAIYETLDDFRKDSPVSSDWEWTGKIEHYDKCLNKTDTNKTIPAKDAEECKRKYIVCLNKTDPAQTITAANESDCIAKDGQPVYAEGEPVYKMRASKVNTDYDKITLKIVESDYRDYLNLSCDGKDTEETSSGGCDCTGNKECKVWYTGSKGDLKLGANAIDLVYSRLQITAVGFPEDSTSNMITFQLNANTTYNVQYTRELPILINNPGH